MELSVGPKSTMSLHNKCVEQFDLCRSSKHSDDNDDTHENDEKNWRSQETPHRPQSYCHAGKNNKKTTFNYNIKYEKTRQNNGEN